MHEMTIIIRVYGIIIDAQDTINLTHGIIICAYDIIICANTIIT